MPWKFLCVKLQSEKIKYLIVPVGSVLVLYVWGGCLFVSLNFMEYNFEHTSVYVLTIGKLATTVANQGGKMMHFEKIH